MALSEGAWKHIRGRRLERTHLGPKYMVVAYRDEGDKTDIMTACFTSDLKRVKGEVEWPSQSVNPERQTILSSLKTA